MASADHREGGRASHAVKLQLVHRQQYHNHGGRARASGNLNRKGSPGSQGVLAKQPSIPNPRKEKLKTTLNLGMLNAPLDVVSVSLCFNAVTCHAVVDSGSTCSLISEVLWMKVKTAHEKSLPAEWQTSHLQWLLAGGPRLFHYLRGLSQKVPEYKEDNCSGL